MGIVLCILGLLGNLTSTIIWRKLIKSQLKKNQTAGIYFIALAICDSGLLVFFLLHDSLPSMFPILKQDSCLYAVFFSWFGYPFHKIFFVGSIWLIVGITTNRFLMIIFPIKVKLLYTPKRTYQSIFIILLLSTLINIPHFFNFKPEKGSEGKWKLVETTYGASQLSFRFEFWTHCIIIILAPWICLVCMNAVIVYTLSARGNKISRISNIDKNGSLIYCSNILCSPNKKVLLK